MDWTPYVSAIVAAIIAGGASYGVVMGRLSKLESSVDSLQRSQADAQSLSNQITALSVKMDDLKDDVGKHNQLIERTFQLEYETKAQWNRIDELRDQIHDVKVGGSK